MASGVQVADRVKDLYNDMKVVKNDACEEERIRLVIFGFSNNLIDVEKTYTAKDMEGQDPFAFFQSQLIKNECKYILYDCHFETKESSKKEELVFTLWCPDEAPIKAKMNYASSKDALRKIMGGIKHDMQLNDLSDCGDRDTFASKLAKNIITLEGKSVKY